MLAIRIIDQCRVALRIDERPQRIGPEVRLGEVVRDPGGVLLSFPRDAVLALRGERCEGPTETPEVGHAPGRP
ncbi:MAG: hypothetical protein ACK55I_20140 [bacterium]